MKIEYVYPTVETDELSVWGNYRQIKTINDIIALVNSWQDDTALLDRMAKWYGTNTHAMPVFDDEWVIDEIDLEEIYGNHNNVA